MAAAFLRRDRAECDRGWSIPVSCRFNMSATARKSPERVIQYVTYPLTWMASQVFFIHPMLILLGITLFPRCRGCATGTPQFSLRAPLRRPCWPSCRSWWSRSPRSLTGRSPIAMWGYPLWSLLPLAAMLWFGPVTDLRRMRVFHRRRDLPVPAGDRRSGSEPGIADRICAQRPKASDFPGRAIAEQMTRRGTKRPGRRSHYVAGTEFAANNVAVYSPTGRMSLCMAGRASVHGST